MGIVHTIPEAAMDYVLYGDNSAMVSDYLQYQLSTMPAVFNNFTQRIRDAVTTSYNYVTDAVTKYGIMSSLQQQGVRAVDSYIVPLQTFEQLQGADMVMQRWIMSHPQVRQLYLQQDIDGYSESYQNVFGSNVGQTDYNYRMVMDGKFVDESDGSYTRHFYHDELIPGDRQLEYHEKATIRQTWHYIDNLLQECKFDFTCNSEEPVKINRS